MNNRTRLILGVVLGVASFTTSAGPASSVTGNSAGELRQLVRKLASQGSTSFESPIAALEPDWLYVGNPKSSPTFVELVPSFGGIRVTTRLPITGQAERPPKDIAEVLGVFKSACTDQGGELLRKDIPWGFEGSSVPVMIKAFRALIDEGKIGQFWCQAPDGKPTFMVEVVPAATSTVPLIPTGRDWNVAFRVVTADALERFLSREAEYRTGVTTLQSTLKPGAQVQVSTADLPDDMTGPWRQRYPREAAYVCGLVTEVKPPLATVQFQGKTIAVAIEKLFPQGEHKAMGEMNSQTRKQPQSWCLK